MRNYRREIHYLIKLEKATIFALVALIFLSATVAYQNCLPIASKIIIQYPILFNVKHSVLIQKNGYKKTNHKNVHINA